jgi:hypothetical protein
MGVVGKVSPAALETSTVRSPSSTTSRPTSSHVGNAFSPIRPDQYRGKYARVSAIEMPSDADPKRAESLPRAG